MSYLSCITNVRHRSKWFILYFFFITTIDIINLAFFFFNILELLQECKSYGLLLLSNIPCISSVVSKPCSISSWARSRRCVGITEMNPFFSQNFITIFSRFLLRSLDLFQSYFLFWLLIFLFFLIILYRLLFINTFQRLLIIYRGLSGLNIQLFHFHRTFSSC